MRAYQARSLRYMIEQAQDIRLYQQRNPGSPVRHLIELVESPMSKRDRQRFREILRRTR